MTAAFRERFPASRLECGAVEDSNFFDCKFDAIIAGGLLFLLPADVQAQVIGKVRGRIRASAGVAAFLPAEAVQTFDEEHAAMLAERFPDDPLLFPHRVWALVAWARRRNVRPRNPSVTVARINDGRASAKITALRRQ
jgi:hypothetical protein